MFPLSKKTNQSFFYFSCEYFNTCSSSYVTVLPCFSYSGASAVRRNGGRRKAKYGGYVQYDNSTNTFSSPCIMAKIEGAYPQFTEIVEYQWQVIWHDHQRLNCQC